MCYWWSHYALHPRGLQQARHVTASPCRLFAALFLWGSSVVKVYCSKKNVGLECLALFLTNCILSLGQCHSPLARSLRIAWRTEEQLLCRCGLWKGQKSWQHLLYHIFRPALWIQWKKAARQVGGVEGEFYILLSCSICACWNRAGITTNKGTGNARCWTTSSESHWVSATLWFTLEGQAKIVLLLGKGGLLIIEALSFSTSALQLLLFWQSGVLM